MRENVVIPEAQCAALRALNVRSAHLLEASELLKKMAQEFDLEVLRFYRAHGLTPDQVATVDLDGGFLVLKADESDEA